jgi:hypothetical protein
MRTLEDAYRNAVSRLLGPMPDEIDWPILTFELS